MYIFAIMCYSCTSRKHDLMAKTFVIAVISILVAVHYIYTHMYRWIRIAYMKYKYICLVVIYLILFHLVVLANDMMYLILLTYDYVVSKIIHNHI